MSCTIFAFSSQLPAQTEIMLCLVNYLSNWARPEFCVSPCSLLFSGGGGEEREREGGGKFYFIWRIEDPIYLVYIFFTLHLKRTLLKCTEHMSGTKVYFEFLYCLIRLLCHVWKRRCLIIANGMSPFSWQVYRRCVKMHRLNWSRLKRNREEFVTRNEEKAIENCDSGKNSQTVSWFCDCTYLVGIWPSSRKPHKWRLANRQKKLTALFVRCGFGHGLLNALVHG